MDWPTATAIVGVSWAACWAAMTFFECYSDIVEQEQRTMREQTSSDSEVKDADK